MAYHPKWAFPASVSRWPNAARWAVAIAAPAGLAWQARAASHAPALPVVLALAAIAIARFAPIRPVRGRRASLCAPAALAGALWAGGFAAGAGVLAVYAAPAILRRDGRRAAMFAGTRISLAAQAAGLAATGLYAWPWLNRRHDACAVVAVLCATLLFAAIDLGLAWLARRAEPRPQHIHDDLQTDPLVYAGAVPAVALSAALTHTFGSAIAPFLLALFGACAMAIRREIECRTLRHAMSAIRSLGDASVYSVRQDVPLQTFLALASDLVEFESAVVWMSEPDGHELRARASHPAADSARAFADTGPDSVIGMCMTRSTAIIVENTKMELALGEGMTPQSWLVLPLVFHEQVIGVARFVRSAGRPFRQIDLERVSSLMPHASVAFVSARVRQQMVRLANLATTDGLTGLINHRRCHEVLQDEFARASRYNRTISVLMIDVDSFKQFNDTFGHPQGDVLLRSLAGVLRTSIRGTDHVGRYGGEEFMIILPETDRDSACYLAERLCRTIAETPFEARPGLAVQRTVSIGVAEYPANAQDPAALVRLADEALYRAKRDGKNRAVAA